jgi:LmbE family N-acetylglucosaminyl deacetylase
LALFAAALVLCLARASHDPRGSRAFAVGAEANAQEEVPRSPPKHDASGSVEWLVVAPHPDDATLIAAGVIARAVRQHEGVAVAFMTNGDLTCARDGVVREDESIRALAELGLDEQHVYFLGYPDGYLARLGHVALSPVERRIDGRCVRGNDTYAVRGHDGRDVHSTWFGESAAYTAENAVTDLSALLETLRPRQIVVTHPMDVHPDHAATYALLQRALARTGTVATLHRAFVHAGDCWPLGPEPAEPCPRTVIDPSAPFPPLSGALHDYRFTERLPVPDDFLNPDVDANPKLRAIRTFRSQLGPSPLETYLFTFSRREEPFFVESPVSCGPANGVSPCTRYTGPAFTVALSPSLPQQSVRQDLPLAVAFDWPKSPPAIDMLADESGAYRLAYDERGHAAILSRLERGTRRTVKTWLLPQDLWGSSDPERVELRFDPRPQDGDVAEITLLVRRELVGVAVDVHPRRTGQSVRAVFDTNRAAFKLSLAFLAGSQKVPVRVADGTVPRGETSGAASGRSLHVGTAHN